MVNATQLSSFMYCARKLFISNVLLVAEPVKEELVKGTVYHQAYEWINKHEQNIVEGINTKDYPSIVEIYRKEFAKALRNTIIRNKRELKEFNIKLIDIFNEYWPGIDEEAKARSLNVASFASKHDVLGKKLWEKLSPKILSEQYLKSENLGISGIIDVIEVYDNKIYVPVELKTGKVPDGNNAIWPGHRVQLATYMMLLEAAGKDVSEGVLRYKGAEQKRVLVLNSLLKDEVLALVKQVSSMLSSFDLPDRTDNKKKCEKCSFRAVCYDDGEMARLVDEAKVRPAK